MKILRALRAQLFGVCEKSWFWRTQALKEHVLGAAFFLLSSFFFLSFFLSSSPQLGAHWFSEFLEIFRCRNRILRKKLPRNIGSQRWKKSGQNSDENSWFWSQFLKDLVIRASLGWRRGGAAKSYISAKKYNFCNFFWKNWGGKMIRSDEKNIFGTVFSIFWAIFCILGFLVAVS